MRAPLSALLVPVLLAACADTAPRRAATFPAIAPAATACRPVGSTLITTGTPGRAEQRVEDVVVTAEPDDAETLLERGFRMSLANRRDEAVGLINLALARANSDLMRGEIYWSYGWAMFNLREYDCALARFDQARALDRAQNRWVDYTLALAYWQKGEREVALDWFDRARAREPQCWAAPQAAAGCTRSWQPQERRALGELFHASRQRAFVAESPATGVMPKRQAPPRMEP